MIGLTHQREPKLSQLKELLLKTPPLSEQPMEANRKLTTKFTRPWKSRGTISGPERSEAHDSQTASFFGSINNTSTTNKTESVGKMYSLIECNNYCRFQYSSTGSSADEIKKKIKKLCDSQKTFSLDFVHSVQSHLKFKVALNPMYRIFLNFAKSCILSCLSNC